MNSTPKILVCDDDASILITLRLLLETAQYEVIQASSPSEADFLTQNQDVDLMLMDMNYNVDTTSGTEGIALIETIRQRDPLLPIVVMTGWATIELAVSAMQKGANDFVQKPWENERLLSIIATQLKLKASLNATQRLTQEKELLVQQHSKDHDGLVAESEAMKAFMHKLEQVACTESNLLLTGENGVGKSLLANYVHSLSSRKDHSFISVNMGAITESLFESEMFGHVKGAFTDAKQTRLGRFELADKGTLFLDEIANLPDGQQAKLLRVLESKQFEPVGSSKTKAANVRIISATNADLSAMTESKQFRMDLLYRLNTVQLEIPPLRSRLQDIPVFAQRFCQNFCQQYQKQLKTFSDNALECLREYAWPGNVRELSHVVERAVIFSESTQIESHELMLPETSGMPVENSGDANKESDLLTIGEIEKQALEKRLEFFSGNANDAAKSLGLSRSAFYRRLDKYKS